MTGITMIERLTPQKNSYTPRKYSFAYKNYVMIGGCLFDMNDSSAILECKKALQLFGSDIEDIIEDLVDSANNKANQVCSNFSQDTALRLADFAHLYCIQVENDELMRSIIMRSKDIHNAIRYCYQVSCDEDILKVVLSSDTETELIISLLAKDKKGSLNKPLSAKTKKGLYQQIINSKRADLALSYCLRVDSKDVSMKDIILNSDDEEVIHYYHKLITNSKKELVA